MPIKSKRLCKYNGCNLIVATDFCEGHAEVIRQRVNERYRDNRPQYKSWYNTARWKQARIRYLTYNPLCVHCLNNNNHVPAVVVDHIIPHKGNHTLFWDVHNWQALCKRCHDIKTATTDGGFGNKID